MDTDVQPLLKDPSLEATPLLQTSPPIADKRPEQDDQCASPDTNEDVRKSTVFRRLIVGIVIFITSITMTIPVRPNLILRAAGNDAATAAYFQGLVSSVQNLFTVILSPLFGAASDVAGRKPLFLFSHLGELSGLAIIGFFHSSLVPMFVGFVFISLTDTYLILTRTMIADLSVGVTSRAKATANFGTLGAVAGLCFIVGPTLGGIIEAHFYTASSFHFACFGILSAITYVFFFLPETNLNADTDGRLSFQETGHRMFVAVRQTDINPFHRMHGFINESRVMPWLAATYVVLSLAESSSRSIILLYLTVQFNLDSQQNGFFLSLIGLGIILTNGIIAPTVVHFVGEKIALVVGLILVIVHLLMYAFATTTSQLFATVALGSIGYMVDPILQALIARQVDPERQGSLQGSFTAMADIVKPIGPLFISSIFALGVKIGFPGLPFLVLSVLGTIASGLALFTVNHPSLK